MMLRARSAFGLLSVSVAMLLACTGQSRADVVGEYQFTYIPTQSGLTATIESGLGASGTLIGNYNLDTNPTGTRTKPGLSGPFGDTENVAVNVNELGAGFNGTINTDTTGAFALSIDTAGGAVTMNNYNANFLGNGPASLPLTLSLSTQTFRTRSPSFIYPGLPIELPIGEAQLTALSLSQAGPSLGTLTSTGPNTFDFSIATLVTVSLSASILGQSFDLPGAIALPFVFGGSLTLNGQLAQVTSLTPISFDQSQQPGQTLPQFPLALPTLDPNNTANVLLDLTLSDIGATITGNLATTATGVLIPAPASAGLALGLGLASLRRRRDR